MFRPFVALVLALEQSDTLLGLPDHVARELERLRKGLRIRNGDRVVESIPGLGHREPLGELDEMIVVNKL